MMARIAVYAGSFDPITRGHEDLIRRSLAFVDSIVVAVTNNVSKQPLFPVEERMEFIRQSFGNDEPVDVRQFQGLLVDFARSVGARVAIRGLRAVSDFEYEYQMALMNRHLYSEFETIFMVPSIDLTYVSSSLVREVARFGGDTSDLVHPQVDRALRQAFASK
ncbi:MAG: pantetheine-phosphate adenylyltransferase [Gemmatimonadaceae bacterium]